MRDALKRLVDGQRADLQLLDDVELQELEAQCEMWRLRVNKERARRRALPAKAPRFEL
jgi:hypothetical protein